MAHWLPKLPFPIEMETFELKLNYEAARPSRAAFLAWQLAEGGFGAGWKTDALPEGWEHGRRPDGGAGAVPETFTLTLRQPGAALTVRRESERVWLTYQLWTLER